MVEDGIPVVLMGLGEIGRAIARAALSWPDLRIAGAVDPAHAGSPLEALLGVPCGGLEVAAELGPAASAARGGVVLHATGSRLADVLPQLEEAVRLGLSVVSTCEELAYPWYADDARSDELHELCAANGVVVLGTGVNPGFVLDRVPALLSQVTGPVRRVRATRIVDLSTRRAALRKKVGLGLTEAEFESAAERQEVGHVGLTESAILVAKGCEIDFDWPPEAEEIESVVAQEDGLGVLRGQVAGLVQNARLLQDGREVVRLELEIHAGAENPRDEVEIDADPPVRAVVMGGVPGEIATANAVVHAARAVGALSPGLATVLELPTGR